MRAEVTLASLVWINDGVVFRDLQGETAILHLGTGVFFGLDPIATRIWQLIQARRSLDRVLAALLDEYDVDEDRCAQDVLAFVAALRANDLVTVEAQPAT